MKNKPFSEMTNDEKQMLLFQIGDIIIDKINSHYILITVDENHRTGITATVDDSHAIVLLRDVADKLEQEKK